MNEQGPDVVIRGPWTEGHIEVDGEPFPWPIAAVSWSMPGHGAVQGAIPTLILEIECSRIRIDHTWPSTTIEPPR